MPLKFGKKPPRFSSNTLLLRDYLTKTALPLPPVANGWEYAVSDRDWSQSMLGNGPDVLPGFPNFQGCGNCVWAAILHFIMAAQANVGKRVVFTTAQAVALYSKYTGYDPAQTQPDGSNPTDNGTAITDALEIWRTEGIYGHFIKGSAAINPIDYAQNMAAMYAFGGLLTGIRVTSQMMQQFQDRAAWNSPFNGTIEGRHAFPIFGKGRFGETGITWARRQPCDLDFPQLMDESYVVITDDWLDAQGKSPSGLDLATLQADLQSLA